jgi:undecaprenyl-diphosphatase
VDRRVGEALCDWARAHPLVVDLLRVVTALGRPQTLTLLALIAAAALAVRGRARVGLYIVVATVGAWVLDNGLKDIVDRARPSFGEPLARTSGASFPSGHAMTAAAAYGAIAFVVRHRVVTAVAVTLVAAIALTRVALGVHWPSDVAVGALLGAAWAWATARVLLRGEEDVRT